MKRRILSLLVLLAAVATGAVAQTTYKVSVKEGTEDADKWTIEPAEAKTTGVAAGTTLTLTYSGTREVKSVKAVEKVEGIDLSKVTANLVLQDGDVVTGTLGANVQISIADGATVTLKGVTINGVNDGNYQWAGLTCAGDATIILADGSVNAVKGFHQNYPGIFVPENKTLTIKGGTTGDGQLTASSNGSGAGIGGANCNSCGNIVISGGEVTATGGQNAAGIGSGFGGSCGTITALDASDNAVKELTLENIPVTRNQVTRYTGSFFGSGGGGGGLQSDGTFRLTADPDWDGVNDYTF